MAQSASVRSDRRLGDVKRFYKLLDLLEETVGGKRCLTACHGGMHWPRRGVYFFFEPGETRSMSGSGPRVVRVGTHGLRAGGDTTLWKRLRAHRGPRSGGDKPRGSVFRKHIGRALKRRYAWADEAALGKAVSQYIGRMPFLWLAVDDPPGPNSLRGYIERNAIALLSHNSPGTTDSPSPTWLGRWAANEAIRTSGLWNVNHVTDGYDKAFLDVLLRRVRGHREAR